MSESHGLISIPYKDGGIPIYRTCQHEGQNHPGLILIHEVWGLTDHIKSVADRLCKEGFEVITPDLLAGTELEDLVSPDLQRALFDPVERSKRQPEIRAMMAPLGLPEFAASTLDKLQACFDYLSSEPDVSKVGVIGFCFGGTYAFGLATNQPGLAAAVPFYGHGEQYIDGFQNINCPIKAFYGKKDEDLNAHIPQIEQAMEAAGKRFSYEIYDGAGHAFFNDTNPLTYNKAAALDAWPKAVEFLHQNIG